MTELGDLFLLLGRVGISGACVGGGYIQGYRRHNQTTGYTTLGTATIRSQGLGSSKVLDLLGFRGSLSSDKVASHQGLRSLNPQNDLGLRGVQGLGFRV